jgi:hypothetical protein
MKLSCNKDGREIFNLLQNQVSTPGMMKLSSKDGREIFNLVQNPTPGIMKLSSNKS